MRARSLACTRLVLMLTSLLMVATAATPARPTVTAGAGSGTAAQQAALLAVEGTDVRPAGVPAPEVTPRRAWDPGGACPVTRGDRTAPQRLTLHHTHEPTVATPEEVPGALRLICRAHRDRGFSEIGYHYAIDPFGRIWQGRGPMPSQITERVRNGAHAQGFNHNSIGVVLIGDYEETEPPQVAVDAAADLMAFLADQYGIAGEAVASVTSTGGPSTRFVEGTTIDLPVIAGHRDTGNGTLCPGEHLYELLPWFRRTVAERVAAAR